MFFFPCFPPLLLGRGSTHLQPSKFNFELSIPDTSPFYVTFFFPCSSITFFFLLLISLLIFLAHVSNHKGDFFFSFGFPLYKHEVLFRFPGEGVFSFLFHPPFFFVCCLNELRPSVLRKFACSVNLDQPPCPFFFPSFEYFCPLFSPLR